MKAAPIVRRATREDAAVMARELWLRDAAGTMWERFGITPEAGVLQAIEGSIEAWTWELDGKPACMWGVSRTSIIGGKTIAWFLATRAITRDKRTFWTGSKRILAELRGRYGKLEGYCDARFTESVRWLTKLGFRLHEPTVEQGIPFHYFEMT